MEAFEENRENNTEQGIESISNNLPSIPFSEDTEAKKAHSTDSTKDLSEYIEKFPTGIDRKKILTENKKDIETFKKLGAELIRKNSFYAWTDSPLDLEDTEQEPIRSAFLKIIPTAEKSIKSYVEDVLKEKSGEAIGIEFGGIGTTAFSEFTSGFFKKSLAITLVDHRRKSLFKQSTTKNLEQRINHTVIKADILDDETYDIINEKIDSSKVDLIIERMARGLDFIPPEPYLAMKTLQRWYDMLAEGGLMFVQIPVIFNELLVKWEKLIRDTCPTDILEFDCQYGSENKYRTNCSSIRIRKLKGAPEELPTLDHRTIADTGMSKDSINRRRSERRYNDDLFNNPTRK